MHLCMHSQSKRCDFHNGIGHWWIVGELKWQRKQMVKDIPTKLVPLIELSFAEVDTLLLQWQVRCNLCTMSFKDTDKLSIEEMQEKLGLAIQ